MFVKSSWRTYKGNRYQQFHLAESFRDPETGRPRHRLLMNLTPLPPHVIEAIRRSLREGRADPPLLKVGDILCGAGSLAVDCAWQRTKMDALLSDFSPRQRDLIRALVGWRVLRSGARLAEQFRDIAASRFAPVRGLDEGEVPRLTDMLGRRFYAVLARLRQQHAAASVLGLYEMAGTSAGTRGVTGGYAQCRDRCRAVVGLVLDKAGIPLAVEVWSAGDLERTTVLDRIDGLRERFANPRVVFVGDRGEPGAAGIRDLAAVGLDYVLGPGRGPGRLGATLGRGEWDRAGVKRVGYAPGAGSDGPYFLETSLPAPEYPPARIDQLYRALHQAKEVWRSIVRHQGTRPVHEIRRARVYGNVLLCFLAYYLVKTMELEMRQHGETRDGELVLRDWNRLRLVEVIWEAGGQVRLDRQWSLGRKGREIRDRLRKMGWWPAIEEAARDLIAGPD